MNKCQYTRKHQCRGMEYIITRNGKPRIYCNEAVEQTIANGDVIYIIRHLDARSTVSQWENIDTEEQKMNADLVQVFVDNLAKLEAPQAWAIWLVLLIESLENKAKSYPGHPSNYTSFLTQLCDAISARLMHGMW